MATLPTLFIPHGGGPWPFLRGMVPANEVDSLAAYLSGLPATLPDVRAVLVVSAHWEAEAATVMTAPRPPLLFDYHGFPPETYRLRWPAPGAPELAQRVTALLSGAGFPTAVDAERGFDHGTFVPLMVAWPRAEIPTIQLSLLHGLDPRRHLELGRALRPLRDEGVLVVGSGMTFHNMRGFGHADGARVAESFDSWLQRAAVASDRDDQLLRWTAAPGARLAHPREEHLVPLHVVLGAAGSDPGALDWTGTFGGARISAFRYG